MAEHGMIAPDFMMPYRAAPESTSTITIDINEYRRLKRAAGEAA
jgi:hypothetical protein